MTIRLRIVLRATLVILMANIINKNDSILIIDDDFQIRNHLRMSLKQYGYHLIHDAFNAESGVTLFKKHSPDITFLDINLPDHNGLSVLNTLLEINSNAYIVMLSGESTLDNVKRSVDQGAKGFIVKPFKMKKIVESLSKLD